MSTKKQRNARAAASRRHHALGRAEIPWRTLLASSLGAATTVFLLTANVWIAPVVVAPLLAGIIVGLVVSEVVHAALSAGIGGLVGGTAMALAYRPEAINANFAAMPPYANPDVLVNQLYGGVVTALAQHNPVTSGNPGAGATVLLVTLIAAGTAAATSWIIALNGASRDRMRMVGGWVVVALLSLAFIVTGLSGAKDFKKSLEQPLVAGQYGYDAYIYMGAYQRMLSGTSYYRGYLESAKGDARLIKENSIRNDKFYGFVWSPTLIRQPWTYRMLRLLAPQGGSGPLLVAIFAVAALMLLVYWGFSEISTVGALLAPVLIYPVFLMMTSWMNIFFPDYWASIAMLASLALLLRRQMIPAIAFALGAALLRETFVFWLFAVLLVAAIQRKERSGVRDMSIAAASLAVFVGLYALHYVQAGELIAAQANAGAQGFLQRLSDSAHATLAARFMAPTEYMMWPYAFFRVPGFLIALAGTTGFALLWRKNRLNAWLTGVYGVFWFAFYATVGATSSYWGQQVMPYYLVGVALAIAAIAPREESA